MKVVFLIGAGALALALGACDAGPSATARAPGASYAAAGDRQDGGQGGDRWGGDKWGGDRQGGDPRDEAVPLVNGKPMWAANRRHTAQENADYQFGKNGKDFGAATETDYVQKAHAFIDAPPSDVQKVERSNGDVLLYDPKSNTFAVEARSGAPRTLFKPRDGAAYWRQQVARQSDDERGGGQDSQS